RTRSSTALDCPPVRTGSYLARHVLSEAVRRKRGNARPHAAYRRDVFGMPVLRRTPDGSPSSPPWMGDRTQACSPADAQDRPFADLSGAKDERAPSRAQEVSLSVAEARHRTAQPRLVR